ncbi:Uncharacterized protein APZ42_022543 [Daphnia magna]|uniref:Uncharacterized protein n=1 Tax=Daphnia magna TaxID=35525 RepID=A0A164VK51_9CRUS|nr:Uncharacterized protein APZ42_022543 [Daphnia magna]
MLRQRHDETSGRSRTDVGRRTVIERKRTGSLLLAVLEELAHLALPRFDDVVERGILQSSPHRQNLWRNRNRVDDRLLRRDPDWNSHFIRRAAGRPSSGLKFRHFAFATLLLFQLLSLELLFHQRPRRLDAQRTRMRRTARNAIRLKGIRWRRRTLLDHRLGIGRLLFPNERLTFQDHGQLFIDARRPRPFSPAY